MGRARKKASPEWLTLTDAVQEEHQEKQAAHKQTVDALIQAARIGLSPAKAAALVGISQATLKVWLEAGNGEHPTRRPTPQLERLAKGWAKSRAEFCAAQLKSINESAAGWIETQHETSEQLDEQGNVVVLSRKRDILRRDWKAAAWLLERAEPEEWAERDVVSNDAMKDAFTSKIIEVDRIPGRRIEPRADAQVNQMGDDRPKVMLVPHVTDEKAAE